MARTLLQITGTDSAEFLQGLVTNDVSRLSQGPIYAAILTPQGKYFADFFLIAYDGGIGVDIDDSLAADVQQRLGMYKLRADVKIAQTGQHLHRGLGDAPEDGWIDPRIDAMGWRAWRNVPQPNDDVDWDALRVAHLVPETGKELTPDSYILECGFEALNGVDFRKGCYVGQEVTARMKHKTELRKGLARIAIHGDAASGDDILVGEKVVGRLLTRADDAAIAYLRFDRAQGEMSCGSARVSRTT